MIGILYTVLILCILDNAIDQQPIFDAQFNFYILVLDDTLSWQHYVRY